MSADRVRECPKCVAAAKERQKKAKEKLRKAYGKVSPEKYKKMMETADTIKDSLGMYSEYFEIGLDEHGEFVVRYNGSCSVCGFSYSYSYDQKVSLK